MVLFADQNCPSASGRVDDSAIWTGVVDYEAVARGNATGDDERYTHIANKTIGGLQRPAAPPALLRD